MSVHKLSRRITVHYLLPVCLFAYAQVFATGVPPAEPKAGKTVTPPLSARVPEAVSALPSFGSITWETTQVPWVEEGPYAGISGMGMVAIDGKIYVVGGFIPGGDGSEDPGYRTSQWTWRYDPKTKAWDRMADAPFRREYVRAAADDGKMYMLGGGATCKGCDPPYQAYAGCAVFDPYDGPTGTWETIPSLPAPRTHMAVGIVGNQLIAAGGNQYVFSEQGYSHNTIRDTVSVYYVPGSRDGWVSKPSIPGAPRGWCASAVEGDTFYLFGGITWTAGNQVEATQETLRYAPWPGGWSTGAAPPLPISGWEGDSYADQYILNAGGVVRPAPGSREDPIWSDLVFAYEPLKDRWFRVDGALPPGAVFNDPGVVIIGNKIFVLGAEGPYGSHYNYFLTGRIAPVSPTEELNSATEGFAEPAAKATGPLVEVFYRAIRCSAYRSGIFYYKVISLCTADDLPQLHALMRDENFGTYWARFAKIVGLLGDESSVDEIIHFVTRPDAPGRESFDPLGKVEAIGNLGMVGGPKAQEFLRSAATMDGARSALAPWLGNPAVTHYERGVDRILECAVSYAAIGLALTQDRESLLLLQNHYQSAREALLQRPPFRTGERVTEGIEWTGDDTHAEMLYFGYAYAMGVADFIQHNSTAEYFRLVEPTDVLADSALDSFIDKYSWPMYGERTEDGDGIFE